MHLTQSAEQGAVAVVAHLGVGGVRRLSHSWVSRGSNLQPRGYKPFSFPFIHPSTCLCTYTVLQGPAPAHRGLRLEIHPGSQDTHSLSPPPTELNMHVVWLQKETGGVRRAVGISISHLCILVVLQYVVCHFYLNRNHLLLTARCQ